MSLQREGPYEGSTCLVNEGAWIASKITRVNEDGTFNTTRIENPSLLMPFTYGVTERELVFNDGDYWDEAFRKILSTSEARGKVFKQSHMLRAFSLSGFKGDLNVAEEFLKRYFAKRFPDAADPAAVLVDSDEAFEILHGVGLSAKYIVEVFPAAENMKYASYYLNNVRMAGRDPSDIARSVTFDDGLSAWGLQNAPLDPKLAETVAKLEEKHKLRLPENLKTFVCKENIADVMHSVHCNGLEVSLYYDESFHEVVPQSVPKGIDGKFLLQIISDGRGDNYWYAAFNENDTDARIYCRRERYDESEDGEDYEWKLVAPTVGMFFWDLAQSNLVWYICNSERRFVQTDIGLRMPPELTNELMDDHESRHHTED